MYLDNRTVLSDKQAITGDAVSTNVIDLSPMGSTYDGVEMVRKFAIRDIPFLVQVTEEFNTLTSLTIAFQSSDTEVFTVAKNELSFTVPLADLVVGYKIPLDFLPKGISGRYLRMNYTVVGTDPTAGAITACAVGAVERRG